MYFRDVIGLQDVKRHLIESVQQGFIPHARIFYGPEGVGKLPLAIAYARYLNCSHRGAEDACGQCPSCHKFDKLAHPDLHFVFPVVKSKVSDEYLPEWRQFLTENHYFNLGSWLSFIDAQNAQGLIYAKESDEIIRKLSLKVYEAPYKVMIVWLPEKMHESCANKLLKMVEEPPANTVFLLVSEDPENVLQTILMRAANAADQGHRDGGDDRRRRTNLCDRSCRAIDCARIANGSFTRAIELLTSSEERAYQFELFKEMMRASISRNIKEHQGGGGNARRHWPRPSEELPALLAPALP